MPYLAERNGLNRRERDGSAAFMPRSSSFSVLLPGKELVSIFQIEPVQALELYGGAQAVGFVHSTYMPLSTSLKAIPCVPTQVKPP